MLTPGSYRLIAALVPMAACGPSRTDRAANQQAGEHPPATSLARVCASPTHGIVVSNDSIAAFPIHATLGMFKQICTGGNSTTYDAVGGQAVAWVFPFVGASEVPIQSKHGFGETTHDDESSVLWAIAGDSVPLSDGYLLPETLGEFRSVYGPALVDYIRGDAYHGPGARACRLPYLWSGLAPVDGARHVRDSARITHVEWLGNDSAIERFCVKRRSSHNR